MNKYLNEFFSLRCAPDILAAAPVLKHKASKEIAENMAARRRVKKIALKEPMKYAVVDLCSGNALLPLMTTFTLPLRWSYGFDLRPQNIRATPQRFSQFKADIFSDDISFTFEDGPVILTAIHPCKSLAQRVIEIYHQHDSVQHLIMMPCCVGTNPLPPGIQQMHSKYEAWCLHLALSAQGDLFFDKFAITPANGILTASKE